MPAKTGILLLNMGGPDSLENVKPFLYNLFSDPDIIRLPFSTLLQKPLAWQISTSREEEAKKNYAAMGGYSPILKHTQAQADALNMDLKARGYDIAGMYIAMRYWHPFTAAAVDQILKDGIEELIVVPLYPHFSYTTTGSSLNELKRILNEREAKLKIAVVPSYYDHPIYRKAVAENIEQGLNNECWTCPRDEVQLLFTAHSLPLKHLKRTKDPYPDQVYETAKQIAAEYCPHNPWELSYQSQVGKMPWLGPSTDGVLHYFSGKHVENILMVAISFVSDHVETLVEIDQLYVPMANELGIPHCHRAPALNESRTFIQALSALVIAELKNTEVRNDIPAFDELLQVNG